MTLKLLFNAFLYMQNGPFFWQSFGFTIAIAMFIGAAVYDGHVDQAKKGLISVGSYAFMLLWITLARVTQTYLNSHGFSYTTKPEYALAGVITLIFVSLAWMIGISLGVWVFKIKERF